MQLRRYNLKNYDINKIIIVPIPTAKKEIDVDSVLVFDVKGNYYKIPTNTLSDYNIIFIELSDKRTFKWVNDMYKQNRLSNLNIFFNNIDSSNSSTIICSDSLKNDNFNILFKKNTVGPSYGSYNWFIWIGDIQINMTDGWFDNYVEPYFRAANSTSMQTFNANGSISIRAYKKYALETSVTLENPGKEDSYVRDFYFEEWDTFSNDRIFHYSHWSPKSDRWLKYLKISGEGVGSYIYARKFFGN